MNLGKTPELVLVAKMSAFVGDQLADHNVDLYDRELYAIVLEFVFERFHFEPGYFDVFDNGDLFVQWHDYVVNLGGYGEIVNAARALVHTEELEQRS